ncbi:MAG: hypothetical protein KGN31_05000 [Betaproteobacteria bacterium]|nr:hypothetical protein [Betaproteobacteria bacterium]MDE2423552.1 hypothetical protein [Betaproteobacteria bacterium]
MKRLFIHSLVVILLSSSLAYADGGQSVASSETSSSGGGGGSGAGLAIAGVVLAGLLVYFLTGEHDVKPSPAVDDQSPKNINQQEIQNINQPNKTNSSVGTDQGLEY